MMDGGMRRTEPGWQRWGLVALVLLTGCALGRAQAPYRSPEALVDIMRAKGWESRSPLALDAESLALARHAVGAFGTAEERLRRAVHFLNGPGGLHFQYAPNRTLPAQEAFHARTGDCMTYALLLTAVAREVGVPTYFIYVDTLPIHYDADGFLYTASHIAVGLGRPPNVTVADFLAEEGPWSLSAYRKLGDAEALALYSNNRAVEHLTQGDVRTAERMLREVLRFAPELRETYANLGVALRRQGRTGEALALLRDALTRFPTYAPLWSNAILAARAMGYTERVQQLERAAEAVVRDDPSFMVRRGVAAFRAGDYRAAIPLLEGAAARIKDSTLVRAWLVRAYLAAKEEQKGTALFAALQRESPGSPLLQDLARQFPRLAPAMPQAPSVAAAVAPQLATARVKGKRR